MSPWHYMAETGLSPFSLAECQPLTSDTIHLKGGAMRVSSSPDEGGWPLDSSSAAEYGRVFSSSLASVLWPELKGPPLTAIEETLPMAAAEVGKGVDTIVASVPDCGTVGPGSTDPKAESLADPSVGVIDHLMQPKGWGHQITQGQRPQQAITNDAVPAKVSIPEAQASVRLQPVAEEQNTCEEKTQRAQQAGVAAGVETAADAGHADHANGKSAPGSIKPYKTTNWGKKAFRCGGFH